MHCCKGLPGQWWRPSPAPHQPLCSPHPAGLQSTGRGQVMSGWWWGRKGRSNRWDGFPHLETDKQRNRRKQPSQEMVTVSEDSVGISGILAKPRGVTELPTARLASCLNDDAFACAHGCLLLAATCPPHPLVPVYPQCTDTLIFVPTALSSVLWAKESGRQI